MALVPEITELNKALEFKGTPGKTTTNELHRKDAALSALPGQPRVRLQSSELLNYLREEHKVIELDKAAPWLWMIATPFHGHISALHHQSARGRRIVVTENPRLHLVWYYDRIFIKPIPPYLLSHAFWRYIEENDQELVMAAKGFLRSYTYLIRYEADFRRAQSCELGLIPKGDGEHEITFERFAAFIAPFAKLDDTQVCPRYEYGELRLSRLNTWAPFLVGKLTYHHINAQWSVFFSRAFAGVLTTLLVLNTMLSSMQVELAVQAAPIPSEAWNSFSQVSRWFVVAVMTIVLCILVVFFIVVLFLLFHDLAYARMMILRKRSMSTDDSMNFKSGVV